MTDKQLSNTTLLHKYLCERGANFTFFPDELPKDQLNETEGGFNNLASLHRLTIEGRLQRAVATRDGRRPCFRYTVLDAIHQPRKDSSKPKNHTSNRKPGYHREKAPAPLATKDTVPELVDKLLDLVGELQGRAAMPLCEYTDHQLLQELLRRNNTVVVTKEAS